LYKLFYHIGRYVILVRGIFKTPEKFSIYYRLAIREAVSMTNGSLFIVVIISTFIGAVQTIQIAYQLETGLLPDSIIGSVVAATSMLELAPTVISFILAGRIGSNIASQIGTMRVTEQIDALEVMGINSKGYLLIPRIVAGIISFPVLITIAAFLMIWGGMMAGDLSGEVTITEYSQGMTEYYDGFQITVMYIKAVIFGFLIASISAYQGYFTRGGALEVGEASTRAVVYSCLTMVIADYTVAELLL
jgi:phospholipid/cholesterol/gamma-HCH transport system permease protein